MMTTDDATRFARERFGNGAWVRRRHKEGNRIFCVIFNPDDHEIARGDTFEEAFAKVGEEAGR